MWRDSNFRSAPPSALSVLTPQVPGGPGPGLVTDRLAPGQPPPHPLPTCDLSWRPRSSACLVTGWSAGWVGGAEPRAGSGQHSAPFIRERPGECPEPPAAPSWPRPTERVCHAPHGLAHVLLLASSRGGTQRLRPPAPRSLQWDLGPRWGTPLWGPRVQSTPPDSSWRPPSLHRGLRGP